MYLIMYLVSDVQMCANTLVKAILKTSKTASPSCDLMVTLCWRSAKAILAWSNHPLWWINGLEQAGTVTTFTQTLKE